MKIRSKRTRKKEPGDRVQEGKWELRMSAVRE
jgi:hypothetical protein